MNYNYYVCVEIYHFIVWHAHTHTMMLSTLLLPLSLHFFSNSYIYLYKQFAHRTWVLLVALFMFGQFTISICKLKILKVNNFFFIVVLPIMMNYFFSFWDDSVSFVQIIRFSGLCTGRCTYNGWKTSKWHIWITTRCVGALCTEIHFCFWKFWFIWHWRTELFC